MGKRIGLAAATLLTAASVAAASAPAPAPSAPAPVKSYQTKAPKPEKTEAYAVEVVRAGLNHPWGLQFLDGGKILLVTERSGTLSIISADGTSKTAVAGAPKVEARDQGGLFDVVLGPTFKTDGLIWLAFLEPRGGGKAGLSVARAKLVRGASPRLEELKVIFRAEPASEDPKNIGGRLIFARDGTLFVTVGDRFEQMDHAQSLADDIGKIVRIRPDGTIPRDNPFVGRKGAKPEIYAYGVRNDQGAAINPATGRLWVSEHGPRGGDEINIILPGKNYGWPVISYGVHYSGQPVGKGEHSAPGMEQPLYYWTPSIAPSGLAFYTGDRFPAWKGDIFVGALKFQHLARLHMQGGKVVGEEKLLDDKGWRIRDVRQGPDGLLYVLTDEDDGRILRLVPKS